MTGKSPYAIPTARNVVIVLAQLGGIVAAVCFVRVAHPWWEIGLLALAFGILMNSVYSIIHEAEHGILFPNRQVNDGVGIVLAAFFPAPFHLIRQGHIGHHMRNRSDDEAFDLYFEGEHPAWKWLQLYGILTGLYWVVVVLSNIIVVVFPFVLDKKHFRFDKPATAFMESLNPRYKRYMQAEGLFAILLHTALLWGLHIPPLQYVAMYFGFGFTWSAMQYVHHYGTERDVIKGARNLFVWGPLDRILLNHNWHQTHHAHPTVPWVYLPKLGRQENPRRNFLPWAYLRMWRGPRMAREHVENRYAGRIIQ
jgi:fatty acid desaturase